MKKLSLLTLLVFGLAVITYAGNELPSKVKKAFNKKFDVEAGSDWYSEKSTNNYFINFKKDNARHIASFDAEGNWVSTKSYYTKTEKNVPKSVKALLGDAYPADGIIDATMMANGEGTTYKIHVEAKGGIHTLAVDKDSNITEVIEKSHDHHGHDHSGHNHKH
jgi:hypothetical protein